MQQTKTIVKPNIKYNENNNATSDAAIRQAVDEFKKVIKMRNIQKFIWDKRCSCIDSIQVKPLVLNFI